MQKICHTEAPWCNGQVVRQIRYILVPRDPGSNPASDRDLIYQLLLIEKISSFSEAVLNVGSFVKVLRQGFFVKVLRQS